MDFTEKPIILWVTLPVINTQSF